MRPSATLLLAALLLAGPVACRQDNGVAEQADPVIATVGETKITETDDLGGRVLGLLLDQYAAERKLEASDEEVGEFISRLKEAEKAGQAEHPEFSEGSLTEAEKKEVAGMRDGMARSIIKAWKVNKALFDEYGGRVIYQQGGAEPLDAYRKFLEAQMKAGAFTLSDKKYEADLWRMYTNDELHDFAPDDQRATLIHTPPWEKKESTE
jgi:hypothetical protein